MKNNFIFIYMTLVFDLTLYKNPVAFVNLQTSTKFYDMIPILDSNNSSSAFSEHVPHGKHKVVFNENLYGDQEKLLNETTEELPQGYGISREVLARLRRRPRKGYGILRI